MRVLIDGTAFDGDNAAVSVFDWAVLRGFAVFEVIRSYEGHPFRLHAHLDRLERSAAALSLDPPRRSALEEWVWQCAAAGGDCQVRVVMTGGGRDSLVEAGAHTIVMWEPLPEVPSPLSLLPMRAPWHPATDQGGFPGVKWTSYAPHMVSTDTAQRAGFDDALLIAPDGIVLEGPTFTVAWVCDGRIETPSLELGILHSITRDVLLEAAGRIGLAVFESSFPIERLVEADEALALSTTKQLTPVSRIGEHSVAVGEAVEALVGEFGAIVADEIGGE